MENRNNKAEHAVQSYAAGIGGRETDGRGPEGEYLVLLCQNRGLGAGPGEHSSTNFRHETMVM